MALAAGTRLGPYELVAAIGAGGMGDVYKARDTRLDRFVAIKVLSAALASDPQFRERFECEARSISALNHPNICALYDVGRQDSSSSSGPASEFLVMEYLEGESLAARLERGTLPIDQALEYGGQIASALDRAHRAGIVHRDLKPANIFLVAGAGGIRSAKLLDFGLAKQRPQVFDRSSTTESTNASTFTSPGIIVGTVQYMSPEQLEGRNTDHRSDIWSFGMVFYEMITGVRPFGGESVAAIVASILNAGSAAPSTRRAGIPASLDHVVEVCLAKDPEARWQSAADVGRELSWIATAPRATAPAARRSSVIAWTTAALSLAVAAGAGVWTSRRPAASHATVSVSAEIGVDASLGLYGNGSIGAAAILSPDGTTLVFAAEERPGAPSQIFVRRLDQLSAKALPGTEDGTGPFFSPDSRSIGFFAEGKLKKVSIAGGAVVTICDAVDSRGGTWAENDDIIFAPSGSAGSGLMVVPAGGSPRQFAALAPAEQTQRWPQQLPGGRGVLYTASATIGNYDTATIWVRASDGTTKLLVRNGHFGRYVQSGHLLYVQAGTLFAVPFNLARLEIAGAAVPVIENVGSGIGITNGSAQFAASETGTLVYVEGRPGLSNAAPLVWLDRSGKTTTLRAMAADWSNPAFSPNGRQLAMDIANNRQTDIWLYDWSRDALTRLTLDSGEHWMPTWTPDGTRVAFREAPVGEAPNLFWRRADGAGEVQRLTHGPTSMYSGSWHRSGRVFAYVASTHTGFDIRTLELDGNETAGWSAGKESTILTGQTRAAPAFSPDGRWIAYQSDESGTSQVYVQAFPSPGGKWMVSTEGGSFPVWSRTRNELLFAAPDNHIMVASYSVSGDTFVPDTARRWADVPFFPRPRGFGGVKGKPFDLHPDGDRVVIAPLPAEHVDKRDKIVLVFNFFDELKRIAPLR